MANIAACYTLDAWDSIPARGKVFFYHLLSIQNEAHPTSYLMGTGASFPGHTAAGA
jgi:hypothetical protein